MFLTASPAEYPRDRNSSLIITSSSKLITLLLSFVTSLYQSMSNGQIETNWEIFFAVTYIQELPNYLMEYHLPCSDDWPSFPTSCQ